MKFLIINSVCGIGSTGRLCTDLARKLENEGHEVKIAYGRNNHVPEQFKKFAVHIGSYVDVRLHGLKSVLFDKHGLGSKESTKRFLVWADRYNPDVLWLHNIHGYYINYEKLFDWIKSRPNMIVYWTLHDCWAFTGHCSYFTIAKCDKWKTQCDNCPQPQKYPKSLIVDNSKNNFIRKKRCFCGVPNMKIIVPSKWLANLVKSSFLKEYHVEVQYNEIDKNVFKPTESDFRKRYGLEKKTIILGVANPWDERKGLKDFIKLSLKVNENYRIVLVGLTNKQILNLPKNIIGIQRTNSTAELAEIYTAADVFVNATYEDNYPTTNLEASACGTTVVTYNTGGSPESALNKNVVECGDIEGLLEVIYSVCGNKKK